MVLKYFTKRRDSCRNKKYAAQVVFIKTTCRKQRREKKKIDFIPTFKSIILNFAINYLQHVLSMNALKIQRTISSEFFQEKSFPRKQNWSDKSFLNMLIPPIPIYRLASLAPSMPVRWKWNFPLMTSARAYIS